VSVRTETRTKKNRQAWLAVSRVFGVLRVLSTLSIRQRSEIPKEVKVKLRGGGHGKSDGDGKNAG
jgi:hypothetical protein